MDQENENEPIAPSGVAEVIERLFVRVGERGKCNWVPIEEGSKTMKCTYCGDYDIDEVDDENYY